MSNKFASRRSALRTIANAILAAAVGVLNMPAICLNVRLDRNAYC